MLCALCVLGPVAAGLASSVIEFLVVLLGALFARQRAHVLMLKNKKQTLKKAS
jgi:hypothetical protein